MYKRAAVCGIAGSCFVSHGGAENIIGGNMKIIGNKIKIAQKVVCLLIALVLVWSFAAQAALGQCLKNKNRKGGYENK